MKSVIISPLLKDRAENANEIQLRCRFVCPKDITNLVLCIEGRFRQLNTIRCPKTIYGSKTLDGSGLRLKLFASKREAKYSEQT
jgi:hypothetical protein